MSNGPRTDGGRLDRATGAAVGGASLVLPPAGNQPVLPTLPGELPTLPPMPTSPVKDIRLTGIEVAPVTHGSHVSQIVEDSNLLRSRLEQMRDNPNEDSRVRAFLQPDQQGVTGVQLLQAHHTQLTSVVAAVNSGNFRSNPTAIAADATELARLNRAIGERL